MDFIGYKLKIICLNVNGWLNKRYHIFNSFKQEDPDIVLLNEHGIPDNNEIKFFGYDVIQKNPTQERFDGVAVAVKKSLSYKRGTEMDEGYLSIIVETSIGPIEIATGYQPPCRSYLPLHSLVQLFSKQHPVVLMGDLNARSTVSGYRTMNGAGRALDTLIEE